LLLLLLPCSSKTHGKDLKISVYQYVEQRSNKWSSPSTENSLTPGQWFSNCVLRATAFPQETFSYSASIFL